MEIISDRISVVRNNDIVSVVISSVAQRKKSVTVAVILLLWIIGGIFMIWSFPSISEDKTKIVVIIWLAFWLYFLYVLFRLWRWKKYGHEILKVGNGQLKYKKDVKGRGWVLDYDLSKIEKLRASDAQNPGWLKNLGGDFWNTDCDSLRFNYEDREISLGFQLENNEREKLLRLLGEFIATEEVLSRRRMKAEEWKKESE